MRLTLVQKIFLGLSIAWVVHLVTWIARGLDPQTVWSEYTRAVAAHDAKHTYDDVDAIAKAFASNSLHPLETIVLRHRGCTSDPSLESVTETPGRVCAMQGRQSVVVFAALEEWRARDAPDAPKEPLRCLALRDAKGRITCSSPKAMVSIFDALGCHKFNDDVMMPPQFLDMTSAYYMDREVARDYLGDRAFESVNDIMALVRRS